MDKTGMTYAGSGVPYELMDPFKRKATAAAMTTAGNITRLGFRALIESYGESAFIIEPTDNVPYLPAHVIEGLGTKNLVADAMYVLTGKSYYDQIAQDTVAMIVNDMITLGALPLSIAMHLAVGTADWFRDEKRVRDLIDGWLHACNMSRCVWGGGETPTLKDVVVPGTAELSGAAIGAIKPINRLILGKKIQHGDAIVIIESTGIHANGLTLAREIARKISPDTKRPELGYLKQLSDGRTYGEALLDPTHIYVRLVEDCFNAGVDIHYAIPITGHGWRKFMRASEPFTYVVERLPKQLPIFEFIQWYGAVDIVEAYGNLNMGAGLVLYVTNAEVTEVLKVANSLNLSAFRAGYIESGVKKVVIRPNGLEYAGNTLAVR